MTRKRLPIGIQTFREIREDNCYYVDMAVRFNDHIYQFECKVVELEPEGGALAQIKARGYADKHRASGQPIHLVGVEFSKQSRSVVGFEVETI